MDKEIKKILSYSESRLIQDLVNNDQFRNYIENYLKWLSKNNKKDNSKNLKEYMTLFKP